MPQPKRALRRRQRLVLRYPVTAWERFYALFLIPVLLILVTALLFKNYASPSLSILPPNASFAYIGMALLHTFVRLCVAYALAMAVSIPLALLVESSPLMERLLLPVFDIIQSVPVLAFFPVAIVFFLRFGLYGWSTVFILFVSMLWNVVFSVVGGLKVIPNDIKSVASIFHVRGASYFLRVLLPSVVPYLVTGSLLAWAQGWNIIIVAEVLHTYIPGASDALDLFGIGSVLVHAISQGRDDVFFASIAVLVLVIAVLNLLVWQRLLHYAERFRFD